MKPILFPSSATTFTSQGLGALSDAISCVVREERNGEYELTMEYPVGGIHYEEIGDRYIIYAKPSPYRSPQPFRIYMIESPLNGIVTYHAHHISYDLSGIPVEPFEATSCSDALNGLVSHSVCTNPFSVTTNKSVTANYKLATPKSFRSCLGGEENSILDVFGTGEYEFDKFDVKLYTSRGSDNGVRVAYGKNITDFNMERNLETVVTGVYPYWVDVEGNNLVEIDGQYINIYDPSDPTYLHVSGGAYLTESQGGHLVTYQTPFTFNNILPLDLSTDFDEKPTKEQLKARAEKYIEDNSLGVPSVSIDVSFIDLASTEDYKNLAVLEQVDLCDTVMVEFPMYGIKVKSKIVAIETDVLLNRYIGVTIGNYRYTIADTIAGLSSNSVTRYEFQVGQQRAADYINNTKGTFEWIDNGDGTNGGFTIYEEGNQSWLRCTAGGLGISADGGLTYNNAITKDGVVASKLNVQNNGIDVMKVQYYPEVPQGTIQLNNPITGARGFDVNVTGYGSGYHLYRVDTGAETIGMSAVGNSSSANSMIHMDDPDTGETRILVSVYRDYDSTNSSNTIDIYSPLTSSSKNAISLESSLSSSNVLTSALSLSNRNGNDVFKVSVVDNGTPSFYFDGHTLTWKTFTVNSTTYHVLGY